MTVLASAESGARLKGGTVAIALVIMTVAAWITVAGPGTPCAEFMPSSRRCQFTTGFFPRMRLLCIGQILLLNTLPVFIGLLAASSSRWKSGAHLVGIAVLGAAGGVLLAVLGPWPTIETRAPVHLLGAPFLTSLAVLAVLWCEQLGQLTKRCSRRGPATRAADRWR